MKFDSYHPMINILYFAGAIFCTISFNHPIFLAISYVAAFCYSIKLNGKRSLIFNVMLIPLLICYALFFSCYHHFGVTRLRTNLIGNQITLEAITAGTVRGVTMASVFMIFSCLFTIVSSDKVIYLFGKISPRLSLFLSIMLRSLPRVKKRAERIETSREGIGKGFRQGKPFRRLFHICSLISILITWTIEDFMESAASMKCRGYSLKGRTAFSIYRFDNRDRGLVILFFLCFTIIGAGVLFDQTTILYSPEIVMNRITPVSWLFYGAYAVFLFFPMVMQIISEKRFNRK